MSKFMVLVTYIGAGISLTGCNANSGGSASADIRYRVFELSPNALENVQTGKWTQIGSSSYSVAPVTTTEIATLVKSAVTNTGVLVDHLRQVSGWPRVADTWSYSKADGNLLGGGTGTGFLGVRRRGTNEIRIEYTINHTINTSMPESKIIYEGAIPEDGLVFVRPFERKDGAKLIHVITFEVSNWK